jgi:hypothetical protein
VIFRDGTTKERKDEEAKELGEDSFRVPAVLADKLDRLTVPGYHQDSPKVKIFR